VDRTVTAVALSLEWKWSFITVELVDTVTVTRAHPTGDQCQRDTGEQMQYESVMLAMMCHRNILLVRWQPQSCTVTFYLLKSWSYNNNIMIITI